MTDRDHFAAAALTGLLSRPQWMPDECVPEAYKLADDMLREREQSAQKMAEIDSLRAVSTNHDAAPAATASEATASPERVRVRSDAGTGDTPDSPKPISDGAVDRPKPIASEPAAWATFYPNGSTASVYVGRQPPHAEPLYRHPQCQDFSRKNLTLTDAEREALRIVSSVFPSEKHAATLRGLLERTK